MDLKKQEKNRKKILFCGFTEASVVSGVLGRLLAVPPSGGC